MLLFWKWREVLISDSMQEFARVRDILNANGIKYDFKIVNHNNSHSFGSTNWGNFGGRVEFMNQYYVYVHDENYDEACFLLNNTNLR